MMIRIMIIPEYNEYILYFTFKSYTYKNYLAAIVLGTGKLARNRKSRHSVQEIKYIYQIEELPV
jgi:hypothetical protein